MPKPVALIILDGWGIREMSEGNAVVQANTPHYNEWLRTRERAVLDASGEAVGLPAGQMGNSEVGHLNLGAGRVVYQDITRIDLSIRTGAFFENAVLAETAAQLQRTKGKLHLIGLLGDGGVHSHQRHMFALLEWAKTQAINPIVHVITDGRDTPPHSSLGFAQQLEEMMAYQGVGVIASVSGRYYAMDRDNRWPRVEQAYRAIAEHTAEQTFPTLRQAITAAHLAGVTDEFVLPAVIDVPQDVTMSEGDVLLFYNFRADRMRQIIKPFLYPTFDGFARTPIPNLTLLSMTNYSAEFAGVHVIFPEQELKKPLAEVISMAGMKQLHAAETEKYPHVTYFFNGGGETPFPNEARIMAQSPKVATYDLQPEMSAYELTDKVLAHMEEEKPEFILVNYANPDMVGHTGVLSAAIKAVETVDECAGRLVAAVLAQGGVALVTADHGNCERMVELATGQPHTYHTTNPVSFFIISEGYILPRPRGALCDVAPTVLELLGVPQPPEMTGESLVAKW